jgi:hypothetical protein
VRCSCVLQCCSTTSHCSSHCKTKTSPRLRAAAQFPSRLRCRIICPFRFRWRRAPP